MPWCAWSIPEGETMDSFLLKRVEEGVIRRYGPKLDTDLLERAKKQVAHELKLIAKLGFAGYFLIVWDIVQFCKRHDILIQGRGSAANALEITAIDPVGMELLFERFLSESGENGRTSTSICHRKTSGSKQSTASSTGSTKPTKTRQTPSPTLSATCSKIRTPRS